MPFPSGHHPRTNHASPAAQFLETSRAQTSGQEDLYFLIEQKRVDAVVPAQ
jgi:hypothetical protein